MLVVVMTGDSYRWDVDKEFTLTMQQIHTIIEVFADGKELEYIELNVTNIPMPMRRNNRGISWFGDHAKCVAGFLKINAS